MCQQAAATPLSAGYYPEPNQGEVDTELHTSCSTTSSRISPPPPVTSLYVYIEKGSPSPKWKNNLDSLSGKPPQSERMKQPGQLERKGPVRNLRCTAIHKIGIIEQGSNTAVGISNNDLSSLPLGVGCLPFLASFFVMSLVVEAFHIQCKPTSEVNQPELVRKITTELAIGLDSESPLWPNLHFQPWSREVQDAVGNSAPLKPHGGAVNSATPSNNLWCRAVVGSGRRTWWLGTRRDKHHAHGSSPSGYDVTTLPL
ncbi:hypothetical protein PENSPDRAFT_671563 [Peniophora sp. CONT]|nr:hypothetical protein PENSPDRAFT_671563 [Peniophora sp. CONT]